MATQQEIIKKLMNALDKSSNPFNGGVFHGGAIDNAFKEASKDSNTKFDSMKDVIDSFTQDLLSAKDSETFLREYCGIDLDNMDDGAITGIEAGGTRVKNFDNIIHQDSSTFTDTTKLSTTSDGTLVFHKRGLKICVPSFTEIIAKAKAGDTQAQKKIEVVNGLYSCWIEEALIVNEETFGDAFTFTNEEATSHEMTVIWHDDADSDELAGIGHNDTFVDLLVHWDVMHHQTYKLKLRVNLGTTEFQGLAHTMVHEFTHALMRANVDWYDALPTIINEGMAELARGSYSDAGADGRSMVVALDDYRTDPVGSDLAKVIDKSYDTGYLDDLDKSYASQYTLGFMLLRYFAKQCADNSITTIAVTPNTTITGSSENGTLYQGKNGIASILKGDQIVTDVNGNISTIILGSADHIVSTPKSETGVIIKNSQREKQIASIVGAANVAQNGMYITANASPISVTSETDNVTIKGGYGDDRIFVDGDNAEINGKGGNDVIAVNGDNADIYGKGDNNVITVNGDNALINGYGDNNVITVNGDNALIYGNGSKWTKSGTCKVKLTGDNANIHCGDKDDEITVHGEKNTIDSGLGNDRILIEGNDNRIGSDSSGEYVIASGVLNTVIEHFTIGQDRLVFEEAEIAAHTELCADGEDSKIVITSSDGMQVLAVLESVTGNGDGGIYYNNGCSQTSLDYLLGKIATPPVFEGLIIRGNNENNSLRGGSGADILYGNDGDDTLDGGGGRAYGYGCDTLYGGAGVDYFRFYTTWGTNMDVVGDYESGKDIIDYACDPIIMIQGNDVRLRYSLDWEESLILKDAVGKVIKFSNGYAHTVQADRIIVDADYTGRFRGSNGVHDILNFDASKTSKSVTIDGNGKNNTIWTGYGYGVVYGNAGNDTIWAGTGGGELYGGDGNDVIHGSSGNTTLNGGAGNDILYGGAGVDCFVYGDGHGQDTVYGFESNKDFVDLYDYSSMPAMSESGSDVVLKVKDGESITLKDAAGKIVKIRYWYKSRWSHGYDYKIVTNASDNLNAFRGESVYGYGGNDNIRIQGDYAFVDAGQGNDTIKGGFSGVSVNGGSGNDYMFGCGDGWSFWDGGDDDDTINMVGAAGATINGGNGNDKIVYDQDGQTFKSKILIDGGAGNDTVEAGYCGGMSVIGGRGNDVIYASGECYIDGGDGDDTIHPESFSTIYGGNGNNLIFGDVYGGYIYGGNNNDSIITGRGSFTDSGRGDDTIRIESLYLTHGLDGSGNVTVKSADGNDFIDAKDCHDSSIIGGNGKDTIEIYGMVYNTIVEAGSGNDYIKYDRDKIPANSWVKVNMDTLQGGAGDDTFSISGGHVLIDVGGGKNFIKIEKMLENATFSNITDKDTISFGRYTATSFAMGLYKDTFILKFDFEDKTQNEWFQSEVTFKNMKNLASIKNISIINGGKKTTLGELLSDMGELLVSDKYITGTARADMLQGGSDNDTIYGNGGNDSIYGYAGNDQIYGGSGSDYIVVSSGNNTLDGGFGFDKICGGIGNDSLRGGAGDDILLGGEGNDTFLYADGDGNDTILDYGTGNDVIRLTKGILTGMVGLGGDVILTIGEGTISLINAVGKKITILDAKGVSTTKTYLHPLPTNASYASNKKQVNLAAGFIGTFDASLCAPAIQTVDATKNAKNITIMGNDKANVLKAGSGSCNLYGQQGNDTLVGGRGNNFLEGGAGNDSILGGAGNDILNGGTGNDTFCYGTGDGNDCIQDYGNGSDVIRITKGTITGKRVSGNAAVLSLGKETLTLWNAAQKKITVVDAKGKKSTLEPIFNFLPKNASYGDSKKTKVNLAAAYTGTFDASLYVSSIKTVDASKNKKALTIKGNANANILKAGSGNTKLYGQAGNDTLVGGKGKDYLEGGSGNDSFLGNAGNDSLRGGAGADILRGGAGNDTFYYADGDGKDTILDYAAGDVIRITKGSLKSGKASGKDVILTVGSGNMTLKNAVGKKITIVDAKGKKTVKTYADPTILPKNASYGDKKKTVVNLAAGFTGTFDAGKYVSSIKTVDATKNKKELIIKGNANANILKAGSGNSKLYGQNGNDTLVGGIGRDSLVGGSGKDSLNGGKGNDTLYGGLGNDILSGGAGTDLFLYYNGDGNDTIKDFESNKDIIRIFNADYKWSRVGKTSDVKLTIGKGSILMKGAWKKTAKITDRYGKSRSVKFVESTPNFDKIIKGTKMSDFLIGTSGNDRIYGYEGDDWMDGGSGNDWLDGGSGDDDIWTDAGGNNTVYGGAGNDEIRGGDGNDYVDCGSGDDYVSYLCKEGNNTICGGAGNDYILGGDGIDRFVYAGGDGNDTIAWYESNDIIDLSGVDYTLSCEDDNVRIKLGKGSILLTYLVGSTIRINDRNGKEHLIDTSALSHSSSMVVAQSSRLLEHTAASYVKPDTWKVESTMDSRNVAPKMAIEAKATGMMAGQSIGSSESLLCGNPKGSSTEVVGQEHWQIPQGR